MGSDPYENNADKNLNKNGDGESYLPHLALKDRVRLESDRERYPTQLQVLGQPLGVCRLALVEQLQLVVARRENDLERLVVLLVPPGELTRRVEKAGERVQVFLLSEHAAVRSAQDRSETCSHGELHAHSHLEELGYGFTGGPRDTEWVSGDCA